MYRVIFLSLACCLGVGAFAQVGGIGKPIDIGNNSKFEGFETIDSLVMGKKLIVVGEDYSYAGFNAKFEFKMLKYLNQRFGLKNYILETSPAKADLVNQYISEGDSSVEKLLQSVSSVKYMRMYKNLKKLNSKLPDSLKIQVYGVDVERTNALPLVRMAQALPEDDTDGNMPDNLRLHVESVKGAAKYIIKKGLEDYEREQGGTDSEYEDYFYTPSAFSVRESINEFMKHYDSLRRDFETWLGPKFTDFDNAVNWLKEFKTYNGLKMTAFEYSWREDLMYRRFNSIVSEHPDASQFYVQLGLCRACNGIVSTGCGLDKFSGVLYRLKNLEDSKVKSIVNIGIFYNREFESPDMYMDKQHKLYQEDLELMFDEVDEKNAAFADFSKIADLKLIQKDFDGALLNNGFTLAAEDDDVSDSTSISFDDIYTGELDNSAVYLGYFRFFPGAKLSSLNEQMNLAGLEAISSIQMQGGELSFADQDLRQTARCYYGQTVDASHNYSGFMIGTESGGAILMKRAIKWSFVSSFNYFSHTITDYSNSNSGTFFTDYTPPKVYKNNSFTLGFGSNLILDLSPFYVFGQAGYLADLGKSQWKLNNQYTGKMGSLSNSGWYYGYGFGISIPARWFE